MLRGAGLVRAGLYAGALLLAAGAGMAAEPAGLAILPLRSRGLTAAEYHHLQQRASAAFRDTRNDVLTPEEVAARLGRDERVHQAMEEARRLSGEGVEKAHSLEHKESLERFDRAVALYREHLGEYADPQGLGELYVRRGAERLVAGDPAGAHSDFFAAASVAPDVAPSLDDYPPPVVEAWESARNDRARRPLPGDDPLEMSAVGSVLGVGSVASLRAEKGDRPDDSASVDISVWTLSPGHATPRSSHALVGATVEAGTDALAAAIRELEPIRVAVAPHPDVTPRPDPFRPDPLHPPIHTHVPSEEAPLWRNPWVIGGVVLLLAVGVGGGVLASEKKPSDPGYRTIVIPGG